MTLKEFYDVIKGDYDDAISKFRTDEKARKNLDKIVNEGSYSQMLVAFENKNFEEAYKSAQVFKSACKNVSLSGLAYSVSIFADAIRGKQDIDEEITTQLKKLKKDYAVTMACIQML